eukprot:Nk52_evm5s255 gene=Nk52_evmTU5s255
MCERNRIKGKLAFLLSALAFLSSFFRPCEAVLSVAEGSIIAKYAKASFGSNVAYNGDVGFLKYADNPDTYGCLPVDESHVSHLKRHERKLILAVERGGNCTFVDKAYNAQRMGAKGVVIVNDRKDERLFVMHARRHNEEEKKKVRQLTIPCTMISYEDGQVIKNYLKVHNETSVRATLFIDSVFPGWAPSVERITYIFIPCVMCMLISALLALHFMNMHTNHCYDTFTYMEKLKALCKLVRYPSRILWKGHRVCVICLEEFVDGEEIRVLPCSHGYHMVCIDKWFSMCRRSCPVCKKDILESSDEKTPLLGYRHSV